MSNTSSYRPATIALHGGHTPDAESHARAVPIYQTTSYVFESAEQAGFVRVGVSDVFQASDGLIRCPFAVGQIVQITKKLHMFNAVFV